MMAPPDRFTHSPVNPSPGDEVTFTFDNPELANQTIEIELLVDLVSYDTIEITLDAKGHGSGSFDCPVGDVLTLEHDSSSDHTIVTG